MIPKRGCNSAKSRYHSVRVPEWRLSRILIRNQDVSFRTVQATTLMFGNAVFSHTLFTHSMDKGGTFMGKGNNSQKKETKKAPKDAKAGKAKPAAAK